MELQITELDDNFYEDEFGVYENELIESSFEQIPENTVPIKVIKKGVHFDETILRQQKPMHQSIPKINAKVVRQHTPPNTQKISYEDILSKMGMLVSNGKLHLVDRNTLHSQKQQNIDNTQPEDGIRQNSYIYNKLFKDEAPHQNVVRRPKTLQEYKKMLFEDYIQRHKIKQIKSTKLIMPTSNINFSAGNSANLNKLFNFSKR